LFTLGYVAGIVSSTVYFPITHYTVIKQMHKKDPKAKFNTLYFKGLPLGLKRTIFGSMFGAVPGALGLAMYDTLKELIVYSFFMGEVV